MIEPKHQIEATIRVAKLAKRLLDAAESRSKTLMRLQLKAAWDEFRELAQFVDDLPDD
jgi:hypothetical protein